MADSKISALAAITSLAAADQLAVAHSAASKSIRADHMPGFELDYVERTSNLSVSATTDAGADAFIDGNAVTYDGSTRIKIEIYTPAIEVATSQVGWLNLWDGSTDLGRVIVAENTGMAAYGARFLTPSAAAHTYHFKAHKTTGTVTVYGGAGGAATNMPAWYRITVA